MDTIIASSTQSINERQRPKHRSKKRNSPKRYRMKYESEDDSSDQETSSSHDEPVGGTMRSYHGLMVTNVVGNVTEMSESVVLNIDRSSNSSSEESLQEHIDDNGSNDEDNDDYEELHCDDWEVRMLAAELHQRETKKQISSEGCSDTGDEGRLLRRRRRKESVDAANITATNIGPAANVMNYSKNRPRAGSLDLHSVRRQKCRDVYKTLSFERDKDQL